jgi:SAM-dependent methyltransferase
VSKTVHCNVCSTPALTLAIDLAPPALTTANRQLDLPTQVFVCHRCGHVQSLALPNLAEFYDTEYKISLESEDHDQIYGVVDGKPVYRTDKQAEVILSIFSLKPGAKILDYGAAKASTLRKIMQRRSDIDPYVFDVSDDYRSSWMPWLPTKNISTYNLDMQWVGRFDLITAHYVLEHVPNPVTLLSELKRFLAPGGAIFFSVPNWSANPGDLLVADHVNHFGATSIRRLAREAGLKITQLEPGQLPNAFVVGCEPASDAADDPSAKEIKDVVLDAHARAEGWGRACARLEREFARNRGRKSAIFGAGFYGAFLLTRSARKIKFAAFLDNNPHLWNTEIFGVSVMAPSALPHGIEVIYVGLNPIRARDIVGLTKSLPRHGIDYVFIETDELAEVRT